MATPRPRRTTRQDPVRIAGYEFSREQFWGTPRELLSWFLFILGAPLFMMWSMKRYPLSDPNDRAFLYGAVFSYALSCLLVYIARRLLFKPSDMVAYRVIVGLSVAVPAAMILFGAFLVLNSIFRWRPCCI